jgi:hypothetical protein
MLQQAEEQAEPIILGKYQYYPILPKGVVPGVALIGGAKGVVRRLDFYKNYDYFRGDTEFHLPIEMVDVCRVRLIGKGAEIPLEGIPKSLELCSDRDLAFLANTFPMEELKGLRTFEISLRERFGDGYRSPR